jgi:hypothetical protein
VARQIRDETAFDARAAEVMRAEERTLDAARRNGTFGDPLAPFIEVAATAITEHDLPTFRQAIQAFGEMCEEWIQSGGLVRHAQDMWHPDMELLHGFSLAVVAHLRFLDEACAGAGHPSLRLELVALIEEVAESAARTPGHSLLGVELIYLLRDVASQALDSEAWRVFRDAVAALATIGTACEPSAPGEEGPDEVIEASSAVGWLAERAACAKLPTKPMMYDFETDDPLEAVSNALDRLLRWCQGSIGAQAWSVCSVVLDANVVFAQRLLEHQLEHEQCEHHLVYVCGSIARLGEACARAGKGNWAWVAGNSLHHLHAAARDTDVKWREFLDDFAWWFFNMAACVATVKPNESYIPGEDLLGDMLDWTQEMAPSAVDAAIHKYGRSTDEIIWGLIKELGHRMNSNFRFNFDPVTKRDGWVNDVDDEDDGR